MEQDLTISYKTKTANANDISLHLMACDNSFIPLLSSRINIIDYAQKIYEKAITFEVWNKNELIGLIAAYFTQSKSGVAFITNVSVSKNYKGKGIASKLLSNCISYALNINYKEIKLEVNTENIPAITFYKKHHFSYTETKENSIFLTYQLIN